MRGVTMQLENNFLMNKNYITVDEDELRGIGLDIGEIARCIQFQRKYPVQVRVIQPAYGTYDSWRLPTIPKPKHIYASHDERVVVVIWDDGDKTIARCSEGDTPNVERGIWAATMRKLYGPRSHYKKLFGNVERQGE